MNGKDTSGNALNVSAWSANDKSVIGMNVNVWIVIG
jgi:hypothetical protein